MKYEIIEDIGTINERGYTSLMLKKIKWIDTQETAYALQIWHADQFPGRGIILRKGDLIRLHEILRRYFTPEKAEGLEALKGAPQLEMSAE